MRETDFIGQNKDKWVAFEKKLGQKDFDPDELSRLFIETTDDLAFSRTYYPNRSVRVYLNGVSQKTYRSIYKNRKRVKGAFWKFWTSDLPDAMYHARKSLLVSFLVFVVGTSIGILSTIQDPSFPAIMLSEEYIEMTEDNIAQNNPMGVYQDESAMEMFFQIAWNNIKVSLFCFVLGLLFEVGALFFILYNSVMFGSFIWFFVQRGLMKESFLAVMLHGTIELSMIVVAGAAGVILGRGLVQPDSYSRLQSLTRNARHAMKIMIGVSTFLVIAAVVESYLTRYSVAQTAIGQLFLDSGRLLFIIFSVVIVLGYFVLLPLWRKRKGLVAENLEHESIIEAPKLSISQNILSNIQIVNQSWNIFLATLNRNLVTQLILSGTLAVVMALLFSDTAYIDVFDYDILSEQNPADSFWIFDEVNDFFQFVDFPLLFVLMLPLLSLSLFGGTHFTLKALDTKPEWVKLLINSFATAILLLLPFWIYRDIDRFEPLFFLYHFVVAFVWIIALSIYAITAVRGEWMLSSIGSSFTLIKSSWSRIFRTFFTICIVSIIGAAIVGAPVLYFATEILSLQLSPEFGWSSKALYMLHTVVILTAAGIFLGPIITGFMIASYTMEEINSAAHLKDRISNISFKKRAYGLEKEI